MEEGAVTCTDGVDIAPAVESILTKDVADEKAESPVYVMGMEHSAGNACSSAVVACRCKEYFVLATASA